MQPLEVIHGDISWKRRTTSIGGSQNAIGIVDDFTARSDIMFSKTRNEPHAALTWYKCRSYSITGSNVLYVRLDHAGENKADVAVKTFRNFRIKLEYSPPYPHQSNGVPERYMQELIACARVSMFCSNLDDNLWTEAINHRKWLRNRVPSERLTGKILKLAWDPKIRINFSTLPIFGQQGFSFVYRSETFSN